MATGFATPGFVEFSRGSDRAPLHDGVADLGPCGATPYEVHCRRTNLFPDPALFVTTPICLSGPSRLESCETISRLVDVASEEVGAPVVGGFVQSRDLRPMTSGLSIGRRFAVHLDARTNHRLPLDLDDDELIASMQRDSRSRIRKVVRRRHELRLERVPCDDRSGIDTFATLYDRTADRAGFAPAYRFDADRWQRLLHDQHWRLYLLFHCGRPVGGSVVTATDDGFDYTFAAGDRSDLDVGRALIWMVREELTTERRTHLDLGGGISEGDALAGFKLSMGARPTPFRRARFVTVDMVPARSRHALGDVLSERWPPA